MASARSTASTHYLWDPWKALKILNPDRNYSFTCMGQTREKNRCKNVIGVKTGEAEETLRRLAIQEPSVRLMNDDLEELAEQSCCGRWRHLHAPGAAGQFKQIVADLERSRSRSQAANESFSQRSGHPSPDSGSSRSHTTRSSTTRPTRRAYPMSSSSGDMMDETLGAARETFQRMVDDAVNAILAEHQERLESTGTSSNYRRPRCSRRHVARRLLDDNCGICLESMADNPAQELVWCKKQCGKSVHKECFETWQRDQDGSQQTRCVHWICSVKTVGHCEGTTAAAITLANRSAFPLASAE
ncbi:hypothetical protein NA57DRAFT_50962 [Rhizodiscina lignyota]|uniref:RING-type domain-containing protein n=1 Tax=Rhizodiscina lignyota TaxID=1504668 RepID=A0A9P4IRM0_9PEZI|nr:hypothetical protein NA57DRAFT_50962 [Rhizodiscina lignyota]